MPAAAIENCGAAANASSDTYAARSSVGHAIGSRVERQANRRVHECARIPAAACAKRAFGRGDDRLRVNLRQAAEVAGRADALLARPARQAVDVHRLGRQLRIAPRRRPRRERRPVDADDRRPRRRRDVQRTGVAADEQARSARSSARQLGEVDVAKVEHLARARRAERLPRGGGDAIGGRPIRRPRAEDDAPAIVTGGESGHERRERRLRPAPERVARADVDDGDVVPIIDARARAAARRCARRQPRRAASRPGPAPDPAVVGPAVDRRQQVPLVRDRMPRLQAARAVHRPRVLPAAPLDVVADALAARRSPTSATSCAGRHAGRGRRRIAPRAAAAPARCRRECAAIRGVRGTMMTSARCGLPATTGAASRSTR